MLHPHLRPCHSAGLAFHRCPKDSLQEVCTHPSAIHESNAGKGVPQRAVAFALLINLGVQAMAFIHGHGGVGWHNDDMAEVMRRIDWESPPNFIDINRNPNDTVRFLGDSPARPPHPIAYGQEAYTGGHNPHQVGSCTFESASLSSVAAMKRRQRYPLGFSINAACCIVCI